MKIIVDINGYCEEEGIKLDWEDDFTISAHIASNSVTISANRDGLVSLAKHLLTLAQKEVPIGRHIHLDDINSLEEGSCEMIIEKIK